MKDSKRLLVTADLHFGLYPNGDSATLALAEYACGGAGDVLVIAGDVADADTEYFAACLNLFSDFDGLKLAVPGNHDLWSAGVGSEKKYREVLPRLCSDAGFHMLDDGPQTAGNVGFIGNIGWYDYSFRSEHLKVSTDQYSRKELPGICTWNDARFIDWDIPDAEFTKRCLHKLQRNYWAVKDDVESVIAVLHHVPFRELLYPPSTPAHEFCRAYMGSKSFGQLLQELEKISHVFCGHRHGPDAYQTDHLIAVSVGSEYTCKRLVEMDLASGSYTVHRFDPEEGQ